MVYAFNKDARHRRSIPTVTNGTRSVPARSPDGHRPYHEHPCIELQRREAQQLDSVRSRSKEVTCGGQHDERLIQPHMAGAPLSARRGLERRGCQFRTLFGARREGGAVSVRSARPPRAPAHRTHGENRPDLALLSAGGAPRSSLRLTRVWTRGAGSRPKQQSAYKKTKPKNQGLRGTTAVERRALRLSRGK